MNEKYGLSLGYNAYNNVAKNRLYTGVYRNITDYRPAYLTTDEFDHVQSIIARNIKTTQKHRVYLFTGLLICPECGTNLASNYTKRNNSDYLYYRCSKANRGHLCSYKSAPTEKKLEAYFLEHVEKKLEDYIRTAEVSATQPKATKQKHDKSKIKQKIRRLNVTYMAGGKSDEEYLSAMADLNKQLRLADQEDPEQTPKDLSSLKEFLSDGLNRELYDSFTQAEKRLLWRSLIDEIHFEGVNVKQIKFKHAPTLQVAVKQAYLN